MAVAAASWLAISAGMSQHSVPAQGTAIGDGT